MSARITLTGVDDETSLERLLEISSRYDEGGAPFVEWGVLYSISNQGKGRYPTLERIEQIAELAVSRRAAFALHVCGRAVRDFLAATGHVHEVAAKFPRVQVNFKSADHDLSGLRHQLQHYPDRKIIIQHNEANRNLWVEFGSHRNFQILYDESGGRGELRESWPTPVPNEQIVVGYAGGLGPDNLAAELPKIHDAAGRRLYWVDMEGRLRTDQDRFDLDRAERCLETMKAFDDEKETESKQVRLTRDTERLERHAAALAAWHANPPGRPVRCDGCAHNYYSAPGHKLLDKPYPHSRCILLNADVPMVIEMKRGCDRRLSPDWIASVIPPGCPTHSQETLFS